MGSSKHNIDLLIAARIHPAAPQEHDRILLRLSTALAGAGTADALQNDDQRQNPDLAGLGEAIERVADEVREGLDARRAFAASEVALENMSAADTAAADPDFVQDLAALTRAQVLAASGSTPALYRLQANGGELLESL